MIFQALLITWALLLLFSSAFVMRKELWIACKKKHGCVPEELYGSHLAGWIWMTSQSLQTLICSSVLSSWMPVLTIRLDMFDKAYKFCTRDTC